MKKTNAIVIYEDGGGTELTDLRTAEQWRAEGGGTIYDDVEIVNGDPDGECVARISYLVDDGGGRSRRVEYDGDFSARELSGEWRPIVGNGEGVGK